MQALGYALLANVEDFKIDVTNDNSVDPVDVRVRSQYDILNAYTNTTLGQRGRLESCHPPVCRYNFRHCRFCNGYDIGVLSPDR